MFARLKTAIAGNAEATGRDRRSMPRLEESRAMLIMDGVSYPLIDWNPGGFQIAPFSGKVRGNQKVSVRVIIPHKGETLGFNLTAQIKRIDPVNKAIGGVFVDVDKSIGTKMRALFSERLK